MSAEEAVSETPHGSYSDDDDEEAAAAMRCSKLSAAARSLPSAPSFSLPLQGQSAVFANLCDDVADLQARMDQLQRACDRHRQQLTNLQGRRGHDHCEHLASVYKDMLCFAQDGLSGACVCSADGDSGGGLLAVLERHVQESVRAGIEAQHHALQEALDAFAKEQQRRDDGLVRRVDTMQSRLQVLERTVEAQGEQLGNLSASLTHVTQLLDTVRASSATRDELQAAVDAVTERIASATSQLATSDLVHRVVAQAQRTAADEYAAWQRDVRQSVTQRCALLEERFAGVVSDQQQHMEVLQAASGRDELMRDQLNELRGNVEALKQGVADLQARSPQPLVPAVRDDDAAWRDELAAELQSLRDEQAMLQTAYREDRYALDKLQHASSLEGVFVEVRDWLSDLERRVMSRGETMEVVHRLEEQLGQLRAQVVLTAPST